MAGNDIEITVRVANQTQAGLTQVNQAIRGLRQNAQQAGQALTTLSARAQAAGQALNRLKNEAQDASRALRGLAVNAAAARAALGDLRASTASASNSLRTLQNRAGAADGRLGDLSNRTRTVRGDMDDLDGAVRRLAGNLGGLRGRIGTVSTSSGQASGSMRLLLRGALLLGPALLPIAAAAVPVAANIAAATGALAAFGVAIAPQIIRMTEATQAQGKYADALRKSGAGSKEAVTAENELQAALAKMSPATKEATAGFGALRDATNKWSNSLSSSTMPVFTKSFATLRGMLPSFTPLVKGAATQLERFVTIAAGGVGSGAFDAMMQRFSGFATGALKSAVDGMVHFARTFDGFSGGAFQEFLAYARENAPLVGESLRNLGDATAHILGSMGDLGVSTLGLVNALAKLVSAIPTEFLSTVIQAYATFKLFGLAAAGVMALGGALRGATRSLVAFRAAAVTAGGGLAGLRAAFLGLSVAAKTTIIVAGVTAVVLALSKLTSLGRETPPNIDRLTTSLGQLGRSGKVTGEAARLFGKDLGELYNSVRSFTDPSVVDNVQEGLVKIFTLGMGTSTPKKLAKEQLDAIDEGLSNLVKGGKIELAAAALEKFKKAYVGQDKHSTKEFTSQLERYKAALADAAFEQQLVADSQGLFGQAALATAEKLDAQKRSADGLRGAIQALNDAHRAGLGGMIGFEAAIDAATKAAQENAGALRMKNGQLDLNGEKARNAATALQDLAQKTDEAAGSARESGQSWEAVNGIYERGRAQLIKSAQAMGLTKEQAKQLASQILKTPDKTARLKGNIEDLTAKVNKAKQDIKSVPPSKRSDLKARIEDLQAKVAKAKQGLKSVPPSKRSDLRGNIADLERKLRSAKAQLAGLPGSKQTTWVFRKVTENIIRTSYQIGGRSYLGSTAGRLASGGPVRGPGTGTSDDVPIMASNGEFVVRAAAVQKYGERFMEALNEGRLVVPRLARGGSVTKAEREARRGLVGDLTISRFGQRAGYQRNELWSALAKPADIGSLVDTLNQWRRNIQKATHGGTEARLNRALDSAGRSLLRNAKAHDKVSAELDKAKSKLSDLRSSFNQLRDSVASGIRGSGNIAQLASENGRVTLGGIFSKLTGARDQSKAFAGALETLRKRGVSGSILADIGGAGLEGGGLDTATALLGASKSDIAAMNKLQGQIASNAKAAGTATATAMYGAGIKTAEGLVKGLEKRKKSLEGVMDDVAKSFVKSLKKALGIKGKAHGGVSGGGLTAVGERGWELLDLPAGSRVRPHGDSRRMTAGWGGGGGVADGRPIQVNLIVDGKALARVVFDPLRNEIRNRTGGNVQLALGRGTG